MEKFQESSLSENVSQGLIALVMIVRNEEPIITNALNSILDGIFDQIVIVDQNSTDQTVEKIRQVCYERNWASPFFSLYLYKGEIVGLPEYHYFAAFDKVNTHYILVLDADEEITSDFQTQLRSTFADLTLDGAIVARLNFVFDRIGREVFQGHIQVGHHQYYEPIFRIYRKASIDLTSPPGLHKVVCLKSTNANIAQFFYPCILHKKSAERQLEQMRRYAILDASQSEIWKENRKTIEDFLLNYGWEADLVLKERQKRMVGENSPVTKEKTKESKEREECHEETRS